MSRKHRRVMRWATIVRMARKGKLFANEDAAQAAREAESQGPMAVRCQALPCASDLSH